ncbi:MAG: thrombospondin type 3 repeat-containing protein [Thermoplasmatota archaeon]
MRAAWIVLGVLLAGPAAGQSVLAQYSWTGGTSCQAGLVHFTDESAAVGVKVSSWTWSFGGPSAHLRNPRQAFAVGFHNVTLTVTNQSVAPSSITHSIHAADLSSCCATMDLLSDYQVSPGDVVTIAMNGTTAGPITYQAAALPRDAGFNATLGVFNWTVPGGIGSYLFAVQLQAPNCTLNATTTFHSGQASGSGTQASCQDTDRDGVCDIADNCPTVQNYDQRDQDGDGIGDACDPTPCQADNATTSTPQPVAHCNVRAPPASASPLPAQDRDGDGIPDFADNCPAIANPDQADLDRDGIGDVCDLDMDGDGIQDKAPGNPHAILDNCPRVPNPDQKDSVGDGIGDACRPGSHTAAPPPTRASRSAAAPRSSPAAWGVVAVLLALLARRR